MKELLKLGQLLSDLVWWWWNERSVRESGSRRADPVLGSSDLTGSKVRASDALKQFAVDFANQTHGNRQFLQPFESEVHRAHIIDDFFDIPGQAGRENLRFGGQHILQGTLCSFDLTRKHRFFADIHVNEQVRMRQSLN